MFSFAKIEIVGAVPCLFVLVSVLLVTMTTLCTGGWGWRGCRQCSFPEATSAVVSWRGGRREWEKQIFRPFKILITVKLSSGGQEHIAHLTQMFAHLHWAGLKLHPGRWESLCYALHRNTKTHSVYCFHWGQRPVWLPFQQAHPYTRTRNVMNKMHVCQKQ